jgi:glycosyltransferase involved in cell wall biosynthesis
MKIFISNLSNGPYAYASGDSLAVGGAERQQWFLARALAAAGWSVTVGLQGIHAFGSRTTIDGVTFVSLPGSQTLLAPYQRLLSLYHFLQSELPDWWYWRCASHLLGPAVAIAKRLGILTAFSAAIDSDVNPRRALFHRSRWWPLYAWGLSWSDRIFLQHGGQLSALPSNLRSKSFVVPSIAGESMEIKPHSKRTKHVAWVGQLRQPKRPDLLIEIAQKSTDLRFIVCGGPSTLNSPPGYSKEIIDTLRTLPNVEYRGQVSPQEALKVIADAAIFLCTSDEEGFPNTFLQAWSSGTPVVSLRIDPDHVIEQKVLGIVAQGVDGAVVGIKALMDSLDTRDEIALRARRHVAKAHSEAVVVAAFQRAIQGVS